MKLLTIRSLAFILGVGVLATLIQTAEVWGQQVTGPRPAGDAAKVIDFNYTKTHSFPNILDSFSPLYVPHPGMENSPRLRDLIREGKLWLSLEDAIALTLENNLDIDVARFQIPLAQADYLRSKSGSAARGVTGVSTISTALFAGAIGSSTTSGSSGSSSGAGGAGFSGGGAENVGSVGCCDPVAGFSMGWDQNKTPLGTIALTGVPSLTNQQTAYQGYFGQGFMTGTSYVVAFYGDRSTTTALTSLVNPEVPSGMILTLSQNLLSGFGYRANASSLRIAKNDLQLTDSVFKQQVMTTIAQVVNLYSDLLYYRRAVSNAVDVVGPRRGEGERVVAARNAEIAVQCARGECRIVADAGDTCGGGWS